MNLEDQHGPAAEWVAQEPNQRAIAKKFKNFLFSYGVDGNERIYWHRLRAVCRSARVFLPTLTVTVQHSAVEHRHGKHRDGAAFGSSHSMLRCLMQCPLQKVLEPR